MHSREKIFLAHAGEVANKFLGALEAGGLVARFVDAYVDEFGRQGLKDHAQRYRELLGTLSREALLVMVVQVNAELPRFLTRRRPPVLSGDEVQAADAFAQELVASLARALRWTPEEAEEFRHDLDLYAQLSARTQRVKRRHKPNDLSEGPFVDRCALLLDPSMLDKARTAAGKFLADIEETTGAILQSTLRRRSRL